MGGRRPFSWGAGPNVMKNWLPLEFFPELHIATCMHTHLRQSRWVLRQALLTTPLSVNFCSSPAFSSLNVPPQMLCGQHIVVNSGPMISCGLSHLATGAVLKNEIAALQDG